MDTKFEVGDRVVFTDRGSLDYNYLGNKIGTVKSVNDSQRMGVCVDWGNGLVWAHTGTNLTLAPPPETTYEPPKPDLKDTNPKDAIGSTKLPYHLVPDSLKTYAALAFCEGATKYGAFNWRIAGVRASIYKSALERHLAKWWNGEEADPVTGVPHLASVIACAGIILDARLVGKLNDDRPPRAPMAKLIDDSAETVQHLQKLHKDKNPRHWTVEDSEWPE